MIQHKFLVLPVEIH